MLIKRVVQLYRPFGGYRFECDLIDIKPNLAIRQSLAFNNDN